MFIYIAKKLNQLYKFYDIDMIKWQLLVNLMKPMRFMPKVDSWMQSVSDIFLINSFQTFNALKVISSQKKKQPCTEM